MLLVSLSTPHLPWDWCVSSTLAHYLTDTDTGVTYCRVVWRSLDKPVSTSLCPSSNGPLSTGVYSVEVYDIERDGSVSSVPALAGEIMTVLGPSAVYRHVSESYLDMDAMFKEEFTARERANFQSSRPGQEKLHPYIIYFAVWFLKLKG